MCLSTAFLKSNDGERVEITKNVCAIRVETDRVILTDILGVETPVPGMLSFCDLVNGALEIDPLPALA